MYSPRRNVDEPFHTKVSSPLRIVSSPFDNAGRSAQNKATIDDLDRFYENLQNKFSPNDSIIKTIPDASRSRMSDNMEESNSPNRTSLTPFFERHTISEVALPQYNQNIFEDSDMEDTPSLSDHNDDTPVTRTSLSQKNCNYQSPAFSRSISFQESDMSFNKRMDRLHENLIKVRRMSSFLAEGDDSIELSKDNMDIEPFTVHSQHVALLPAKSPIPLAKANPSQSIATPPQSIKRTPVSIAKINIHSSLATPPQSIDYNNIKRPIKLPRSPISKSKHSIIKDLNAAKLKSAEIVSTPGGSRVANRFWQEIHGLDANKETALSSQRSPITKQTTPMSDHALHRTPNSRYISQRTPVSDCTSHRTPIVLQKTPISQHRTPVSLQRTPEKTHSWAIDENFWSSDTPIANSLNHKLLQAAQHDSEPAEKINRQNIFYEDDEESRFSQIQEHQPVTTTRQERCLVDDDVASLYRNPLFKAQRAAKPVSPKKSRDDDEDSWYKSRTRRTAEREVVFKSPKKSRNNNEERWSKVQQAKVHEVARQLPINLRDDDEESWYTGKVKARQAAEKAIFESPKKPRDSNVKNSYKSSTFTVQQPVEQEILYESTQKPRDDDEESWYASRVKARQALEQDMIYESPKKSRNNDYQRRLSTVQQPIEQEVVYVSPQKLRDDDEESWYTSKVKARQALEQQVVYESPKKQTDNNTFNSYKSTTSGVQQPIVQEAVYVSLQNTRDDDEESWYTSQVKVRQALEQNAITESRDDDEESWYTSRVRARQQEQLNGRKDDDEESLYRNRLFKAQRAAKQESPKKSRGDGQPTLARPVPKQPAIVELPKKSRDDDEQSWYNSRVLHGQHSMKRRNDRDSDEESLYQNRLFKTQKANHSTKEETRQPPQSLFAELKSASTREDAMKRSDIPKVFPNVLAELKAKHGNRLIDDSDEYKFA